MELELYTNRIVITQGTQKKAFGLSVSNVELLNSVVSIQDNFSVISFSYSDISKITDFTTTPETVYENEDLPGSNSNLFDFITPFFFKVVGASNSENIKSNFNVDLATVTALPTNVYNLGTITGVVNQALTNIDSTAPQLGFKILVKNETSKIKNGIYTVTQLGSVSTPFILTRFEGYNSPEEIDQSLVTVLGGSTQKDFQFFQITDLPTLGVDNIDYSLQTTLATTVAKYISDKIIYCDPSSNFATNTRELGDKYNRDKPYSTLQAALNAANFSDIVVLKSNTTENVLLNRKLIIDNCTLTTTAEVGDRTLIKGVGDAKINISCFETSPGLVFPKFENIGISPRGSEITGNNNFIEIVADYCKFTGTNPILRGGFALRPSITAKFCLFEMNSDFIIGENNATFENCILKNTKTGGHIKENDALSNIQLSQNFKNCILQSDGDNLVGGGNQNLRVRFCELNSINGKNIVGFQTIQARKNDFTANALQSENITSTATGHAIDNTHNLLFGGVNLVKAANQQF